MDQMSENLVKYLKSSSALQKQPMRLRACVCVRVKCRLITHELRFHCSQISGTPAAETKLLMASSFLLSTLTFIPLSLKHGNAVWSVGGGGKHTHRSQKGKWEM